MLSSADLSAMTASLPAHATVTGSIIGGLPRDCVAEACAVWSGHSMTLAEPIAAELVHWPDTPTTAMMVRDGLLVPLMPEIYIPPDTVPTATARVLALGCALGSRLRADHIVVGPSAAWVHSGKYQPTIPVLSSTSHRAVISGVMTRHLSLVSGDVETLGGAPVTTPVRTAVDLLRDRRDPIASARVIAMVDSGHLDLRAVPATLDRFWGQPGTRRAYGILREIAAACAIRI